MTALEPIAQTSNPSPTPRLLMALETRLILKQCLCVLVPLASITDVMYAPKAKDVAMHDMNLTLISNRFD